MAVVVIIPQAGMAELVDARDSKSRVGDNVGVRFPLPAPNIIAVRFKKCYKNVTFCLRRIIFYATFSLFLLRQNVACKNVSK